jgi:hypothetical protein
MFRYALVVVVAHNRDSWRSVALFSQRTSTSCHLSSMLKSFQYTLRPLVHAQICCCWCGCCRRRAKAVERSRAVCSNGRPHSPRQLVATSPACSNHSNMLSDLCFMLGMPLLSTVVVVGARDFEGKARRAEQFGRPLLVMHLIVLPLSHYVPMLQICLPTSVSCRSMLLLLWLWWLELATFRMGRRDCWLLRHRVESVVVGCSPAQS